MAETSLIERVFHAIFKERQRQEHFVVTGRFSWTCADPDIHDDIKLKVLVEEVGEVARALCDAGRTDHAEYLEHLQEELVQVAAVATAWAESVVRRRIEAGAWEEAVQ